jgi:metallophosphoesterase (TIGR00282 family)
MIFFYAAEIVGKAGIAAFRKGLPALKKRYRIDAVVVNADGATTENGLGLGHAGHIRKLGADVITLGDFSFYKKDLTQNMSKAPFVIRPYNLIPEAPGRGFRVFSAGDGKAAVVQLLGQTGFSKLHAESPYRLIIPLLETLRQKTPHILIDFHALATAEKKTLFAMVDGLCSAVIGSHTRVQTADEQIGPGGTAYITDAGRTGSHVSVAGFAPEPAIASYLTGIPARPQEAGTALALQGIRVETARDGRALSITRITEPVSAPLSGVPAAH